MSSIECENGASSVVPAETEVDIGATLQRLLREWRLVISVAAATCLVATIAAFLLPVRYSSSASFIPPTNNSGPAAALAGQLSSLGATSLLGGVKSSADLYAGILSSRSIADHLVRRFDLRTVYAVKREADAVKKLQSNTKIEVGTKSPIVTITVKDKTAQRAQQLTDAYLDELRMTNGRLALTEAAQRRMFYDQQLGKEKDNLADAEVDLKKTEEASGLVAPAGQAAIGIETIAETKAQIAAREVRLAALRQSSTDENPLVIRIQSEIADLNRQLAALQKGNVNPDSGAIPASEVPKLQLEYIRKQREVKYHEALFEALSKQDEAARLDESKDAPILQILDSASYPEEKSSPPRTLIILMGLLLGLALGTVYVLGRGHFQGMNSLFFLSRRELVERKR